MQTTDFYEKKLYKLLNKLTWGVEYFIVRHLYEQYFDNEKKMLFYILSSPHGDREISLCYMNEYDQLNNTKVSIPLFGERSVDSKHIIVNQLMTPKNHQQTSPWSLQDVIEFVESVIEKKRNKKLFLIINGSILTQQSRSFLKFH